MTERQARPYRTTFFRDGFPIRDRWSRLGVVGTLLVFGMAFCVAFEWPTASATLEMLRQAYPRQHLRITAFKSVDLETACGFYSLGNDPAQLRYYKSEAGLVAEKTANQWQVYGSDRPYEDHWEWCRNKFGRGHTFDFVIDPIVVALLGASR